MEGSLAAAGAVLLVFAVLAVAATGFWVWSLVDLLRRPDHQWEVAGENKMVWLVVVILLGAVGSVMYLMLPRPNLNRLRAASQVTFDPTAFGVPDGGIQYGDGGFHSPSV